MPDAELDQGTAQGPHPVSSRGALPIVSIMALVAMDEKMAIVAGVHKFPHCRESHSAPRLVGRCTPCSRCHLDHQAVRWHQALDLDHGFDHFNEIGLQRCRDANTLIK